MVGNHRRNINWHHMQSTVAKCAEDAWSKKYAVFGVQFYGECWSGLQGYETYDKDGFNLQGCWEGVGKTRNNYVYAFTGKSTSNIIDMELLIHYCRNCDLYFTCPATTILMNTICFSSTGLVSEPLVDCIYTVTNRTVLEDKCTAPKPHAKMKLCSDVCKS